MAGPLIVCAACSSHVLTSDKACPHCGAAVHDGKGQVLGRTAAAVLMGLALAGCPADDDSGDSMGGGDSSSSASTDPGSSGPSEGSSSTASSTTAGSTADTFAESGAQSAYGTPDTETFGTTDMTESDTTSSGGDTDTDTDAGTDTEAGGTDPGTTTTAPLYGAAPSDE
ncbi:MAG: hypothetical protein ACRBN8_20460 [Nannocystales bacterium]